MRRHTNRLLLCGALVVALPAPAAAQSPGLTIAGGYSLLRDLGGEGAPAATYPAGWFAAASHPVFWRRLSLAGDVSGHARENVGLETQRLLSLLGGAHVGLTTGSRVQTFASALVGVERFSEPGFSESGVAVQPGAGVDLRLSRRIGLRAQVDYRLSRLSGVTYREVRLAVGATLRRAAP